MDRQFDAQETGSTMESVTRRNRREDMLISAQELREALGHLEHVAQATGAYKPNAEANMKAQEHAKDLTNDIDDVINGMRLASETIHYIAVSIERELL